MCWQHVLLVVFYLSQSAEKKYLSDTGPRLMNDLTASTNFDIIDYNSF